MRHPRTVAILLVTLAAGLAGCGSSVVVEGGNQFAGTLTVYSDLPVTGADSAVQSSIVNGEVLALNEVGGHVGGFHVSFDSLDDLQPLGTIWTPTGSASTTAQKAAQAGQDASTIAYIGDFNSGATAISLPITNAFDILQVSPASPYVGLNNANAVDLKGEPQSYFPSGTDTFARLIPNDVVEARATVHFMHELAVKRLYVLSDVEVYDAAIAPLVAAAAPSAGITVTGSQQLDLDTNSTPAGYASTAAAIALTKPDAVLIGAAPGPGAAALWQELHATMPNVKLFAPSTLGTTSFLKSLGPAAAAGYLTSPVLRLDQYPASAKRVFSAYRKLFNIAPTAYTLYGFEAMNDVLAAIRKAGKQGANRAAVIKAFFSLGWRDSVIGGYRISRSGDTTQTRFDGYRITAAGGLVAVRVLSGA